MTSAETVLIQQHSIEEFLKLFDSKTKVYVGISPQSISSLSYFYDQSSDDETYQKLKTFLIDFIGAAGVFDLSGFNELALDLSYLEFEQRYLASAKAVPAKLSKIKKSMKWNRQIGDLPILTSECPGWVCYAEKTVGEEAFPFMSRIKSPQ